MKSVLILALSLFHGLAFASLKDINSFEAPFKLADLPYAENALEPAIDAQTMNIHHSRHHKAYVDNLNKAIGDEKVSLLALLESASKRGDAVRNNAGGHWNHHFFWTLLTPDKKKQAMPRDLERALRQQFGSVEKFKEAFTQAATSRFGSGWAWLIRGADGKLAIISTPNQDNPLMDLAPTKGTPIFGVDVWEHAYYLKYQNKRADYLKETWKVVNWAQVAEYDKEARAAQRK